MSAQALAAQAASGGISQTASSEAKSGPAHASAATGKKIFNIGGNPNVSTAQAVSVATNPLVLGALLIGAILYWRINK